MGETKTRTPGETAEPRTPLAGDGTTPLGTPKSQTEVVDKVQVDTLAEIGRYKKLADTAIANLKNVEDRLNKLDEERWTREEEAVKDDADALAHVRRRRELANREAQLVQREREHADRLRRADEVEHRETAKEVAAKHGVDWETLNQFSIDKASMELLAQKLPKTGTPSSTTNRMTTTPDSLRGTGTLPAGRKPSLEELRASTPFETEAKVKSGEWKL